MSDVSGIPYMGPMGQGNFFAPTFSYNPQMSAGQISSSYMPEIANNQNVVNNLFNTPGGGGGFGRATDYYSQLGANYLAQVPSSWEMAPGLSSVTSGDYGSPAWTFSNPSDRPAYNAPWDYSGGSLGGGGGSAPTIDWNTIFQSAGGGLGGSPSLSLPDVQTWATNWNIPQSRAFDPYPGMSMPGGLNSPMATPQQQPLDYSSLFGRGVGGTGSAPQQPPYTSGIEPDQTGGQTLDAPMAGAPSSTVDWSTLFSGDKPQPYTSGIAPDETGGQTGPAAPQQPQQPQPQSTEPAPVEGGRGGLAGASDALRGYTPREWPDSAYDKPSDPLMDRPLPGNPYTDPEGGGLTATDLSDQARARLAELVAKPAIELSVDPAAAKAAELPVGSEVPLPRDRPEGADASPATPPYPLPPAETPASLPEGASRPPADIPIPSTPAARLTPGADLRGVNPRLVAAVAGGATFLPPGYTVEPTSGVREGKGQSYHSGGRAADFRIIGPDGPIPNRGGDDTGMYTLLARGVKTWVQQNDPPLASQMGYGGAFGTQLGGGGVPDLMHYDLGGSRGRMVPDVQFGRLQPLTEAERNAMPANIPLLGDNQVPLDAPGARASGVSSAIPLPTARPDAAPAVESRVNQGQNVSPPPADIPPPAAVKHSGLELARANIDTPIEQIAMERGGQKAVDQINFMAMGKTPRQLSEQYGGMFMDRAEPLFKSLGITRQDFDRAAAMSPTKQDIKMRFGGGFGGDEFSGQLPTGGWNSPFSGLGQNPDFENRTTEQLGRDQLAKLQAQDVSLPEAASTPLSAALGLENLSAPAANVVGPRSSAFGFDTGGFGEGGYGNAFTPTQTPGPGLDSPIWNAGRDSTITGATETTNLTPGDLTQRGMGDPFNPENYNTLDQAYDLSTKRAKGVAELRSNPDLMRTAEAIPIAEIGPDIAKRSDADIAGFYETMLNNYASGARSADFPTLASILSPKGYYEPIRKDQQSMRDAYAAIDNNPALKARIDRIFDEVSRGSNVSNLSTQNSVKTGQFSEGGEGALQPQFGGVMGQYVPGPGEYFTSMLNPYNDPRAESHIGAGAQQKYREFYRSLMPPGPMPWETR